MEAGGGVEEVVVEDGMFELAFEMELEGVGIDIGLDDEIDGGGGDDDELGGIELLEEGGEDDEDDGGSDDGGGFEAPCRRITF